MLYLYVSVCVCVYIGYIWRSTVELGTAVPHKVCKLKFKKFGLVTAATFANCFDVQVRVSSEGESQLIPTEHYLEDGSSFGSHCWGGMGIWSTGVSPPIR